MQEMHSVPRVKDAVKAQYAKSCMVRAVACVVYSLWHLSRASVKPQRLTERYQRDARYPVVQTEYRLRK